MNTKFCIIRLKNNAGAGGGIERGKPDKPAFPGSFARRPERGRGWSFARRPERGGATSGE